MLIIIGRFFIQEIIMQWYRYQYSQVLEFEQYGGRSLSTGKQHFSSAYKMNGIIYLLCWSSTLVLSIDKVNAITKINQPDNKFPSLGLQVYSRRAQEEMDMEDMLSIPGDGTEAGWWSTIVGSTWWTGGYLAISFFINPISGIFAHFVTTCKVQSKLKYWNAFWVLVVFIVGLTL